jgi:C-terminal processing protease CtpA/Prc
VILGERTYGKGTAQTVLAGFSEPGAHYATVATFALPDGAPVQGRGIHPDVAMAPESSREAIFHAASTLPSTSLEVL